MSGSLPHVIALSNHMVNSTATPGYTTFDLRSDEDTNMAALNARNAKASSDLVVTISEQGQALSQRNKKKLEDDDITRHKDLLLEQEEEFIEDDLEPLIHVQNRDNKTTSYQEKPPTGDFLDQIV
jgi:transposase